MEERPRGYLYKILSLERELEGYGMVHTLNMSSGFWWADFACARLSFSWHFEKCFSTFCVDGVEENVLL